MSQFDTFTSHPLIPNDNNYTLSRKLVSIHSEDRDIAKWPFSNTFSVKLPQSVINCQTMRLSMAQFPSRVFNISNEYQNTKLILKIVGPQSEITITIPDGFYTPINLAKALQNVIKSASGLNVTVHYNETENRFGFCSNVNFVILAGVKPVYTVKQGGQSDAFDGYANWGLPFLLGFDKSSTPNEVTAEPVPYSATGGQDLRDESLDNPVVATGFVIIAPNCSRLVNDRVIYMEVDKYNSLDEIYPYADTSDYKVYPNNPSVNPSAYGECSGEPIKLDGLVPRRARATTKTFSARDCRRGLYQVTNKQTGHPQAAFAKIPISTTDNFITAPNSFSAATYFNPPAERISELTFRFRRHDGRLVDFKSVPFNFTIEFYCLQPEQEKKLNVSVPPGYNI